MRSSREAQAHVCNLCSSAAVEQLIDFGEHPIAHRLLTHPDEHEFTHPVRLGFCRRCGLTQLIDPIAPAELYTEYRSLSGWKLNPHLPSLLSLIEQLIGSDARIVEVGSNDGSFLAALGERGFSNLLGIEPARDAAAAAERRRIPTINDYLTPTLASSVAERSGPFQLLVLRQVAEHIADLQQLAESMRALVDPGAYVLVEVPDFEFSQRAPDYGAIWEEHVNQFTAATLAQLLAQAEIEVLHWDRATFSGQIVIALGRRRAGRPSIATAGPELAPDALAFRDRWPEFRTKLRQWMSQQRADGRTIAVYGAGCRSCCLINYADVGRDIAFVVDDQPEKQGRRLPGSRLAIVSPAALEQEGVDLCLLAVNAENEDKAIARHTAFINRGGEFVSIHPPSSRLPPFWTALASTDGASPASL